MGSGKTTVGRNLATQLGWDFYDLDAEIERKTGKNIQSIFEEDGEEAFRKFETQALHSITSDSAVIATGGGCFPFNQNWMLENGTVVYLEVPFPVLVQRLGADPSRPLWKNAKNLYEERRPLYSSAHLILDGARSPEEVSTDIRNKIKKILPKAAT
jgi:shikimate kinase